MANNVFANGREISCKAGDGKSIAAFPDVCFTPPENPATPPGVPVPYPNTGLASDTTSGSRTVKITGKEVMLKNKSYFKKSSGDEAGCAAKKGVVTSVNRGKVYFVAWSMDVKFEGENVVRHLDMTTHNHPSPMPNSGPTAHVDSMAFGNVPGCEKEEGRAKSACKGQRVAKCTSKCKKAQACILVAKKDDKKKCCKPNNTGHHLIEDHWVSGRPRNFPMAQDNAGYKAAPTVCANDGRTKGKHGILHSVQGVYEESYMSGGSRCDHSKPNKGWNYGAGQEACLEAHKEAFPDSKCSDGCLKAQLDSFYGSDPNRSLTEPKSQAIEKASRPDYEEAFG